MRFKLFAVFALLPLLGGQAALAQDIAPTGDAPVTTSSTSTAAARPTGNRPEQAMDLYQAEPRTGGAIDPSARPDDPVAGALNPPVEPLATDKAADTKD